MTQEQSWNKRKRVKKDKGGKNEIKGKVLILYMLGFVTSLLQGAPCYFNPISPRQKCSRVLRCGKVEVGKERDAQHKRRSCNSPRMVPKMPEESRESGEPAPSLALLPRPFNLL